MKALEAVNHWGDLLIHLIGQKFDNQTAIAWENRGGLPILDHILRFIFFLVSFKWKCSTNLALPFMMFCAFTVFF
jgi:hypothetical protein